MITIMSMSMIIEACACLLVGSYVKALEARHKHDADELLALPQQRGTGTGTLLLLCSCT